MKGYSNSFDLSPYQSNGSFVQEKILNKLKALYGLPLLFTLVYEETYKEIWLGETPDEEFHWIQNKFSVSFWTIGV